MTEVTFCDRCGAMLGPGGRYRLKLALQQAAEPLEITPADLKKDLAAEIERTIAELDRCDPKELEEDVHIEFASDLCRSCRDALAKRLKKAAGRN